jgi:hypothetical protein
MLLALLLLQAVPGPPGDEPPTAVQPCPRGRGEDIVVCARAAESDRLPRLARPVRGAPMTARISPNATVNAEAIGFVRAYIPDNRILAHLTIAF